MRTWASTAKECLSAVSEAVGHLRKLFEMESETPPEMVAGVATEVITACVNLVEWLRSSHAPRGLGKAGGELGAAAGVYRNAAVAFGASLMQTWISERFDHTPAPVCWNRVTIMSRYSRESWRRSSVT